MLRVNIGCGQTPTAGWKNFDNSWSIRLSSHPTATRLLSLAGFITPTRMSFLTMARRANIQWADATRRIPLETGSVDALYSSHMIEHLDRAEANRFLNEARRVLRSGGVLRLAAPDIRFHVDNYLTDLDADHFIAMTLLTRPRLRGLRAKLKYLAVGDRDHQWMYDGNSLVKLLTAVGFADARVMPAGATLISEPAALDLSERSPESVFVEALNP